MSEQNASPLDEDLGKIRQLVQEAIAQTPEGALNRVTLGFDLEEESNNAQHLVADDDVLKLAEASLQLHYEPGRNPYSGEETQPLLYLALDRLMPSGPFWWTSPGLQDESSGAVIWDWVAGPYVLWVRPGVQLPDEPPDVG